MKAILDAVRARELDAKVQLVFSNNADAGALEIARQYEVPVMAIASKGKPREQHEQEVLDCLAKYELDFVVLAGYMRVLTPRFLQAFRHSAGYFRVINIHPSLLPAFPGANAYEDAFNYGIKVSGITIHLVDEKVDHGPILAQETFARLEDDTLESFKSRGLALEHSLYPKVLQQISQHGIESLIGTSRTPTAVSSGEAR